MGRVENDCLVKSFKMPCLSQTEDIKSQSGSSCSGSDREASDAEATKDSREDEKPEQPVEVDQEEHLPPPEEAAAATEAESAVANEELQDSAGDSTEIDISDSSVPSGTEIKQSDDTSEDRKAEETVDEGKEKEGQAQERGEYEPTDTVELPPE